MDRDLGRHSALLWSGIGAHKLGVLVFSFAVGRAGGASALGVMAAVLAVSWIVGTVAGMGLPDRVTFRAAARRGQGLDLSAEEGRMHGAYIAGVVAAHILLLVLAPMIGGSLDPAYGRLAQGCVAGAGLQAVAAYPFCARRGQGRPGGEAAALWVSGAVLAAGYGVESVSVLGAVWAAAGAVQVVAGGVLTGTTPGLGLQRPTDLGGVIRAGLPWLMFGVGAWLVGNMDVLLARATAAPDAVGRLQVGTMAVRAGGVAPWVLATLALHRFETRWRQGESLPWGQLAMWCAGLTAGIAGVAWWLMPYLAAGHGLSVDAVWLPTLSAVCCTPALVAALLLLPIGAARDLRSTLAVIVLGLAAGAVAAGLRPLQLGVSDCIVAAGTAQLVVAVGLVLCGRSGRRSRDESGSSAQGAR